MFNIMITAANVYLSYRQILQNSSQIQLFIMGGMCFGGDREDIKGVCTLNYCGISYSPFEFYFQEHQKQLEQISSIFKKLVARYVDNFNDKFKWEMGKIEKSFKLNRYSNMFDGRVGIEKKKFIDRKEFQELWHHAYQQYLKEKNLQPEGKKEQEQVCLYDFIMYHTLLQFVYGDQPFEELIKNNITKFTNTLAPFYKISFLNEQLKLEKFKSAMQSHIPDVLFIQEYSDVLLKELKRADFYEVTVDKEQDSFVALNKKFFTKDPDCDQIVASLRKQHKWFESSAITVANRIIFCSVHLSSNEAKNKDQVAQLKECINILVSKFKDHHFVVAGDLNSFVKFNAPIFSYPEIEEQFTTLKKRTASQAQFHKAEKEVKESKDKIISSLPLSKLKITFINDQPANDKGYLPTDAHPHDHFLVQAQLSLRRE